jgi:hypothetical protein
MACGGGGLVVDGDVSLKPRQTLAARWASGFRHRRSRRCGPGVAVEFEFDAAVGEIDAGVRQRAFERALAAHQVGERGAVVRGEDGVDLLVGADFDADVDAAKFGRVEADFVALGAAVEAFDHAV